MEDGEKVGDQGPVVKRPPAKEYKFKLDLFQQTAVNYIENNESVLVAAHTSAGKTAVAEYAIATSLRDKQRVIYTSPIKALSNQKYRDLKGEFNDVGLMTGDVTIDPNASCLVMTTEILRSMLYRGSEVMREVAWVIFDEVHYLRDLERGVVWEESIILLPHKVRFVFLSATIPNAAEFAAWVANVHSQPCHVVYTDYRPTPLQHYIYCSGGEGMYLVVDEKGKFNEKNFSSAMATLSSEDGEVGESGEAIEGNSGSGKKKRMRRGGKGADLERIIRMIIERKYDPVIIFSFSKKDCETYALQISKTDLTQNDEKQLIDKIFKNAIASLSDEDKQLSQVQSLLPLLRKGIGIHHGGLLPILKEIVEIMFGEGLLKCLFATETFAMGINMPAKTVVFTTCRKFDGKDFRLLRSGEYIQMSGRAGRRGLDDRGIVILMCDDKLELEPTKNMMSGKADSLTSSFHLGYNMVLNLLRVEDADPEFIVKNSFFVYQREQSVPELMAKSKELMELANSIDLGSQKDAVVRYHRLLTQSKKVEKDLREFIRQPSKMKKFLTVPGRLILVEGWGWGIAVGGFKETNEEDVNQSLGVIDALLACNPNNTAANEPSPSPIVCDFRVVVVALTSIQSLSQVVLTLPKDLKSQQNRNQCLKTMREVQRRFEKQGIPVIEDEKLDTSSEFLAHLKSLQERHKELEEMISTSEFHSYPLRDELIKKRIEQLDYEAQAGKIDKQIKQIKTLPLKDELKRMKMVLRRLGHLDDNDIIQLKGRVACEISTCDELLVCELLLGGAFNDLDPAICAALCSVLVFEEGGGGNNSSMPSSAGGQTESQAISSLKPELAQPFKILQNYARRVAQVKLEADCDIDVHEYVDQFQPDLMEVVRMWCNGVKFRNICEMTEVFEGSIVRTVRREVELLRQLCSACKVIGDSSLEAKFEKAISLMQKGIIFAASLYL